MNNNTFSVKKRSTAKDMSVMAMFTAIILIMAFTPIGIIDLPLIKATILHVPVIIGALLLGPKKGAFFGFLFGLTSFIKNVMTPSILSFAFTPTVPVPGLDHGSIWAVVICFVPRILVGITPWLLSEAVKKARPNMSQHFHFILDAVCGALGAVTNTALVMGLIFIVFKDAYAAANNIPVNEVLSVILGVVFANGIPEMIVAAAIVSVTTTALRKAGMAK